LKIKLDISLQGLQITGQT